MHGEFEQNEVIAAVLAIFPDAEVGADNDGQLVIYTNCMWSGNEGEQVMGNFNPTTDVPFLQSPLTADEIKAKLADGMISGLIGVDSVDLIDGNLDSVLDLLSERLVGSVLGMNISYEPVHVNTDGTIVVRVTLDPSMVLDEDEANGD